MTVCSTKMFAQKKRAFKKTVGSKNCALKIACAQKKITQTKSSDQKSVRSKKRALKNCVRSKKRALKKRSIKKACIQKSTNFYFLKLAGNLNLFTIYLFRTKYLYLHRLRDGSHLWLQQAQHFPNLNLLTEFVR